MPITQAQAELAYTEHLILEEALTKLTVESNLSPESDVLSKLNELSQERLDLHDKYCNNELHSC